LSELEIDETGWLRTGTAGWAGRVPRQEAVEAVADLLAHFETRTAHVVGAQRAHELIATSLTPFQTSLEQLGLTIRVS
jgi:hypothetical protein